MPTLEIRRHAERALTPGGSALSPAGRAMAQKLAQDVGPFALVVASPLHRARETAELVGGRLDAVDPALLPDIGGASIFGEMPTLASWANTLVRPEALTFAEEQIAAWTAIAGRVGPKDQALAISHSGIIDLGAIRLAASLGVPLTGPTFAFLEGVRVTFAGKKPTALEVLRRR